MKFGKKLEKLLTAKKVKPCKLSKLTGLTPAAISKILSSGNEPKWETAQKIIQAFPDVSLRYWHEDKKACDNNEVAEKLIELSECKAAFSKEAIKTFIDAAKLLANK
jgi:transcriptional regulator with XRE-family HTH domain